MLSILKKGVSLLPILTTAYAAPTLYICSDSTTANYATGGALQGQVVSYDKSYQLEAF